MLGEASGLRVAVVTGHSVDEISQLMRGLPEHSGLAVLVACPRTPELAAALRSTTAMPITEVREATPLEIDRIYVLPNHTNAMVVDGVLRIEPHESPSAPIDRLLRSVADELGRNSAAVILESPGTDGVLGVMRVREVCGLTIAQSPNGDGDELARAAIALGIVDLVLDVPEIPRRLLDLGTSGNVRISDVDDRSSGVADALREVLTLVRIRTGHDFTAYKRATLLRRIARRMQVCQTTTLDAYHQHLRENPPELANLLRDFLISVTNFFRDPDVYEVLAAEVIPALFENKGPGDQIRVWVAGCATGEEAYSLAILLLEHAARMVHAPNIQVFATDIDEASLAEARRGHYATGIAVDLSPDRLDRFFVRETDGYRVSQELRERVLFSPHSVLRDPPFSRIDLISCRNLLIYLNLEAQDRVLGVFHFGLRPNGYLVLGASESCEKTALFEAIDAKQRIFRRRTGPVSLKLDSIAPVGRWHALAIRSPVAPERPGPIGELHHRLVEYYAPPSVLVDENLDVVHLSEHAGRFLRIAGGEPTRQLLRLVHPALATDLRAAILVTRSDHGAGSHAVQFDDGDTVRTVELRVRPVEVPELGRGMLLVMFDEQPADTGTAVASKPPGPDMEPVVRELENTLHRTREQLRTTIEQYETSLEELKASNEELQAINEELRSTTEELETSKEELQSVNEELTALNHELKGRVEEISRANNDLQNLMSSTDIGVVFLDRALRIMRFTPRLADLFNVIAADVGRPFAHLTHRLDDHRLVEHAHAVLRDLQTKDLELGTLDGRRILARLVPYRSLEDRIEGVVITFVDVTDLRDAVAARAVSEKRLRIALRDAPIVVLDLDLDGNPTWGYVRGTELASGGKALELFGIANAERFVAFARDAVRTGTGRRCEIEVVLDGGSRTYDFRIEPSGDHVSAVGFDITPSKLAEAALIQADQRKDEFLATLSHELRNPLTPLKIALDVVKLADGDPIKLETSRGIMERQVSHLIQLVDDLLDLSRITQGKLELVREPIDPVLIVESALETTRWLVQQRHHQLRVKLPRVACRVLGDHGRLTQVLVNLITNAAKYTPNQGTIELELEVSDDRDWLTIRVRDDGIGITAEALPAIFDIFVQCRDARGRAQGGLGIGLNVVRRLVELHGGRVFASSAGENLGSEFVVELPILK